MDGSIGGTNKAGVSADGLLVDGSGVTQPISATSLPLPTGAATSANQSSEISILTTIASNTTGASTPVVSGTVNTVPPANASTNITEVGGSALSLGQNTSANSIPVVIASDQSAIPVTGTITTSPNVNIHDGSGNAISSTTGSLNVDVTNTVPVTGTIAATQSGSWTVSLTSESIEIGTVDQGTPNTIANAWPVLPTDGTNSQSFTASGEAKVSVTEPLPAGTNVIGHVITDSGSTTVVTGSVTVAQATAANLNATVTGTVAATQSGTWNITNISGTVSLPTGASTSANQTNGNQKTQIVDGSGNVISSTSNSLNVNVTNTEPISGTVTSNQGTPNTLANAWPVELSDGTNLLGTSAHPVRIDPTGTTTQPVSLASTTITGTVAVTQSTSPWVVSGTVTSNIGTTGGLLLDSTFTGRINTQGQKTMAASTPVVIASDQSAIPVTLPVSTSTALTNVARSNTSQTFLSANSARLGATIFNDSAAAVYVKLGTTASTTSFTTIIASQAYYEVPFNYTGRIDGIWAAGGAGNARITELS